MPAQLRVDCESLPYVTEDLPGIGGCLPDKTSDFIVTEIPLYECEGSGEHVYLNCTREGKTTRDIQKALAKLFGLEPNKVGYAGLKDKQTRATQTFSLHLIKDDPDDVARRIEDALPLKLNWISRHVNKLRIGHLKGNSFEILVNNVHSNSAGNMDALVQAIEARGMPNYYGIQRMGPQGRNVKTGMDIFHGKRRKPQWERKMYLSAFQSWAFNLWLEQRIRKGLFATLLAGDVVKKADSGALFTVYNLEEEIERFKRHEITHTGPIFGYKMLWPESESFELEKSVMDNCGVTQELLLKNKLNGSRRAGRIFPENLRVTPREQGYLFNFSLPKGSYATMLLREIMKV